ncbi:MAG: ankyrin repeat domain-containing protein, partial [Mycobacterium sp.]
MASSLPDNPSLDAIAEEARGGQEESVARRYGFSGWPALVHYLEAAADLSVDPSRLDENTAEPADRFCALAVLRYDESDAPPRRQAAAELLRADPSLTEHHVWAAAAAADPRALSALLRQNPGLAAA